MSTNLIHAVIEVVVGGTIIYDATNKQNKLVALDNTIVLENREDSTGIRAIITSTVEIDNVKGQKTFEAKADIVRVTAIDQIVYLGLKSEKNVLTFFNDSNIEVHFLFDKQTDDTNIIKSFEIDSLALPKNGSVRFLKTPLGWKLIDLFGLTFIPDHANMARTDDYSLLINPDGTTKIEKVGLIEVVDESIIAPLTKSDLNALLPNVPTGFSLVCPAIDLIYKKTSSTGGWSEISLINL